MLSKILPILCFTVCAFALETPILEVHLPSNIQPIEGVGKDITITVHIDGEATGHPGTDLDDTYVIPLGAKFEITKEWQHVGGYTLHHNADQTGETDGIDCTWGSTTSRTASGTMNWNDPPTVETLTCVNVRKFATFSAGGKDAFDDCENHSGPVLCVDLSVSIFDLPATSCGGFARDTTTATNSDCFISGLHVSDVDHENESVNIFYQSDSPSKIEAVNYGEKGSRGSSCDDRHNLSKSSFLCIISDFDIETPIPSSVGDDDLSETTTLSTCGDNCFCGLRRMDIRQMNSDPEHYVSCEITKISTIWKMESIVNDNNSILKCGAICMDKDVSSTFGISRSVTLPETVLHVADDIETVTLGPADTMFCYLSLIKLGGASDFEEEGCLVYREDDYWKLRAYSDPNTEAWCQAMCEVFDTVPKLILEVNNTITSQFEIEHDIDVSVEIVGDSGYLDYSETFSVDFGDIETKTFLSKGSYTLSITSRPDGTRCYFNNINEDEITGTLTDARDTYIIVNCEENYETRSFTVFDGDYINVGGETGGPVVTHTFTEVVNCPDCNCTDYTDKEFLTCGITNGYFFGINANHERGKIEVDIEVDNCDAINDHTNRVDFTVTDDPSSESGGWVGGNFGCVDLTNITTIPGVTTYESVFNEYGPQETHNRLLGNWGDNAWCYLTGIRFESPSSGDGYAKCKVYKSSYSWYLNTEGTGSNEETSCRAKCLIWPPGTKLTFGVYNSGHSYLGSDGSSGTVTSTEDLITIGDGVCFLDYYKIHDMDAKEKSKCEIIEDSGLYKLKTTTVHGSSSNGSDERDSKNGCGASCLMWN